MRRRWARILCFLLGATCASAPTGAWAYDFEVFARTEGYGYQLRRYSGTSVTFLNRRLVTQYMGLRVFNLLDPGQDPFKRGTTRPPATLTLSALMRFGSEFAGYMEHGGTIRELDNHQFDLMVGALEGRDVLGWLDFSLGRQYDIELMDFFAFDGLRVRANLPWLGLFVESHFGLQVAREQPFSRAVFETDGTSGDGTDDALVPTFGVAVGADWEQGLNLRVAYRGTASRAQLDATKVAGEEGEDEDADNIWGIDQELVFFGLGGQLPVVGTRMQLGLRYNLLLGQVDDVQATARQLLGQRHDVQLEYLRSVPHFDGDSIFNIFNTEPFHEVAARYALRILEPLQAHARFGYRRFWSDDGEDSSVSPDAFTLALGAYWRSQRLRANADVFFLGGHGGTTIGGDLAGQWDLWRRLSLEGRLSLIDYQGAAEVSTNGLNFGFQVGAKVRFFEGVLLHVLLEDNISRQYHSALRLLGVLDLEFSP